MQKKLLTKLVVVTDNGTFAAAAAAVVAVTVPCELMLSRRMLLAFKLYRDCKACGECRRVSAEATEAMRTNNQSLK